MQASVEKMDVLFLIEHKDRELEPVIAVAEALRKQYGWSSLIVNGNAHFDYVVRIAVSKGSPKVIVYPTLVRASGSIYFQLFSQLSAHLCLQWEQLLHEASKKFRKPREQVVRCKVHHIAWDKQFANFLIQEGRVCPNNVHITGSPALAVLFKKVEKASQIREGISRRYNLDLKKKWLFFPMNYSWAFFTEREIKFRRQRGYSEEVLAQYPKFARKSMLEFFKMLKLIAGHRDDIEVIVRPHPTVLPEQYRKVFGQVFRERWPESILLTCELSVREWIAASDVVGSSWSTAAYDAFRVGKPAFLFLPLEPPSWLWLDFYDILPKIRSFSELQTFLDNTQTKSVNPDLRFIEFHEQSVGRIAQVIWKLGYLRNKSQYESSNIDALDILRNRAAVKSLLKSLTFRFQRKLGVYWRRHRSWMRDWFAPLIINSKTSKIP